METVDVKNEQASSPEGFEPTIIAFVCNWCTYAGADLAGTSRLKYPANVRCSETRRTRRCS